jgi:predicted AlkP superfamily pyrophosphatase or phosphodiesterase
MDESTVFLYLDALPWRRISSDMPFLSDFCEKGTARTLENVLGYSLAIQSVMLSGTYSDENNFWLPYYFSPRRSHYRFLQQMPRSFVMPLEKSWPLRYAFRELTNRVFREGKKVLARNIPLSVLPYFGFFSAYYLDESPFFNQIREELLREGTDLVYIGPPHTANIYKSLFRCLNEKFGDEKKNRNFLFFVYDDKVDDYSHTYGPFSNEVHTYLRFLDRTLNETYRELLKTGTNMIIFSDHGQAEVKNYVDIISYLSRRKIEFQQDYLCFIDATTALFWIKNERKREIVVRALEGLKVGKVIDERLRKKYHVDFRHRLYGDFTYLLHPEYMFFPNFWGRVSPMRGTHGYAPENPCQDAFFATNLRNCKIPKHVKDIRSVILGLYA